MLAMIIFILSTALAVLTASGLTAVAGGVVMSDFRLGAELGLVLLVPFALAGAALCLGYAKLTIGW